MLSFRIDEHRCLRLLEEGDADELYAVVDANREFLARWMPWAASQTLEATLEFIRSSRKQLADNQGFQVAVLDDGLIVGVLGFHQSIGRIVRRPSATGSPSPREGVAP